jgi:UDP-N-acetylmuramoyl-tripeptide--D-alanyl-D-alanine ligase
VFPADDAHAPLWQQLAGHRPILSFALTGPADVTCHAEWVVDHWAMLLQTPAGASTVQLQVAGWHNVKNALAATACALAAGCPLDAIRHGLEAFVPVKGRSQVRRFERDGQSVTLIDDSYNANPDSVRAAIEVLASLPGPRWLVLGDMGEVGDHSQAFHHEVGAFAKARGIDALWTVGEASTHAAAAFAGARHFDTVASLLAALPQAPACAAVLVKGSRFMKTEQVVAALLATASDAGGAHAA